MSIEAVCLALALYFEARGEPIMGKQLVAETVINRSHDDAFPPTVCGVIMQPSQFSFTSTGPVAITEPQQLLLSHKMAEEMLTNGCVHCTGALYFHAKGVRPAWTKRMTKIGTYGNHVFYKE